MSSDAQFSHQDKWMTFLFSCDAAQERVLFAPTVSLIHLLTSLELSVIPVV
jgi:hypothetical protein